jgi:hypothetical protein
MNDQVAAAAPATTEQETKGFGLPAAIALIMGRRASSAPLSAFVDAATRSTKV